MTSLRQRMIGDMQVRNLSPHTQASYVQQVSLFARHFRQAPEALGPEEIRAYQLYLTNERKLATGSILIAVAALRFLYKVTLHKEWVWEQTIPAPKKPQTLPVVFQSRRSPAVSGLRARPQASHDPDGVLRGRVAHLGGHPAQSHRHRQPTDGHPGRTRQGPERSLRDALAQAAGHFARLVARGQASRVALPRGSRRPSHHPDGRRARLPAGPPALRHYQTDHAPQPSPCLCRPPAGSRHRRAHHPAVAGPPQPGDHGPLLAHRHHQGVRHYQPTGSAATTAERAPAPTRCTAILLKRRVMDRPKFEVAEVFRRYGEAYRQQHGASLCPAQRRVMSALEVCRTAALGGHLEQCDRCGHQRNAYNSCSDRHCAKCQSLALAQWLEARQTELLDTEYFHAVFTLPEPIAAIAYQNKKELYGLLFRTVAETLRTIAADPQHLGAKIGFFAVLHTWGQTLLYHPHLHCVVSGGGLSPDGTQWIGCRAGFFLPVRVLSRLFRRLFLQGLVQAFE